MSAVDYLAQIRAREPIDYPCGWCGVKPGQECDDAYPDTFHIMREDACAEDKERRMADALDAVLALLDEEWVDEPPSAFYPGGRRLARWPMGLRDDIRAAITDALGEDA